MAAVKKKGYATIDVVMVVLRGKDLEIAIDTANQIQVAPQTETTDAIKLIKDGRVLAQKPEVVTLTNQQITLTDNIFYPEVVKMLQGGTVTKGADGIVSYTPPVMGSTDKGEVFEMDVYSSVYDEAGDIVNYEKMTFPGCKGTPISISSQDNVFRLPEYVINSYAKKGVAPYKISYVDELPTFTEDVDEPTQEASQESDETSLDVV